MRIAAEIPVRVALIGSGLARKDMSSDYASGIAPWALYLALLIVLLPLGVNPPELQSLLNRSMVVLTLTALAFDLISKRRRIVLPVTSVLMLCFLAWSLTTLFWAPDTVLGATQLLVYVSRFLLFLLVMPNVIRTKRQLNIMLAIFALNGLILIISSLYSLKVSGYLPGSRFKVMDMNENEAGVLGLVTMVGVLWYASRLQGRFGIIGRLVGVGFMLATLALVALSGSRGSAISAGITLTSFWLWRSSRFWGKCGFAAILCAGIMVPSLFTTTIDRFQSESGTSMLGRREVLWEASWDVIKDHPLRGVGIGNASSAMVQELSPGESSGRTGVSIHNPVLVIWTETGIPGILLYLGVGMSAIWSFVRRYLTRRPSDTSDLGLYYALMTSVCMGYMASWVKGGGMEASTSYFLILAMLLIPSNLEPELERGGEGHRPIGAGLGPQRLKYSV